MDKDKLKKLLEGVKRGTVGVEGALEKMKALPYDDLGFAKIDTHRELRKGFPEVIYCTGKELKHIGEVNFPVHLVWFQKRQSGNHLFGIKTINTRVNFLNLEFFFSCILTFHNFFYQLAFITNHPSIGSWFRQYRRYNGGNRFFLPMMQHQIFQQRGSHKGSITGKYQ